MGSDIDLSAGRGRATRILFWLYRRAERRNATVELTTEEEFKIWHLKWKLGRLLDDGKAVTIIPAIPFEEGGVFHPSNLKIARLSSIRGARAPQIDGAAKG
jgi:hypothetical protein